MFLLTVIAMSATIIFGIAAIIFSMREERAIKKLVENEIRQKQRLYQITMLKEIQDRIGYSLDVEKVVEVITESLDAILKYSTVSSLVWKDEQLIFKTHIKEPVSKNYVESIKSSMLQSITAMEGSDLPEAIDGNISGMALDDLNHASPASSFHIPLLVNDRVVSLMNVSSTKPNLYTEQEMTTLYKIADMASAALSRLANILSVEKGKLMAMIGSLADGLFMVDVNGQLTIINQSAKDFLGIPKDNPTTIDLLSALPNSYDFSGKIQRSINHKRVIEEKEVTIEEKVFQIFITPVFDESITTEKKVIGASVLLHDITLEKSVAKMKEDFTNIMVHELRSPLTAIKASSELLMAPPGPLSDEEKNKIIRLISEQSRKMLDEVSLILDAAKLEAGLFTVAKLPGDLKQLINERASVFQAQAHERFINLVIDIDPSIPNFKFDPIHIGQVVNNLISNSLKFTSSGGTVKLTAKPAIGSVQVSVSDTGAGIPKDKQHLLFSKFTQLGGTQHGVVGTGLGLYIVKGVVEAHGGQVSLESEEGRGTTITFTLPMDGAAASPNAPTEENKSPDEVHKMAN
jgi:signal transduction histidine kinase